MSTVDELARQALALGPDDRAYLVDILEQSLLCDPQADTPEFDQAWFAEIDRRIAAYERGEERGVDLETAMQELQENLAKLKQEQAKS